MYNHAAKSAIFVTIGDRLLWINRKHVEKLSLDEVKDILDNSPTGSNVVVTRWQQYDRVKKEGRYIYLDSQYIFLQNFGARM